MFRMRSIMLIIVMVVSICSLTARERILINYGWEFHRGDWPESKIVSVELPHSYNVEECLEGFDYYQGEATYSRILNREELNSNGRTFVRFGAACLIAEVYFNDKFSEPFLCLSSSTLALSSLQ